MKFFRDITYRNGEGSSKKFWYNVAGLTGTITLLWVCYKDSMEDWAFIGLFCAYMITVGGFEVLLQVGRMVLEWKNGKVSEAPKD